MLPAKPLILIVCLAIPAIAQRAELREAPPISLPGVSDSNSPVHWNGDQIYVFQSNGLPLVSRGDAQDGRLKAQVVALSSHENAPLWIESSWVDEDGQVFAWYHHETGACAGGSMSTPKIGALVSSDNGESFRDLGIIMEAGDIADCNARNGYFAGGHGDFTVLLDHERRYFYFYFGNYGGPESRQGIAVARMAFADRARPLGRVFKFFNGAWTQPGLRGAVTPIIPVQVGWQRDNTDAFWGPSLHWNTYLNQYVMLLSRSCCEPGWPAAGNYVSFNPDLANPNAWSHPQEILNSSEAGWYPMVIAMEPDGTDKQAGEVARFYLGSDSHHEIVFIQ